MNTIWKKLSLRSLFTIVAISLIQGCGASTGSDAQPPAAPQVSVAKPLVKAIVEWDKYTGRLEAVETVEIRARVSGELNSIHFNEGDIIKKGSLLFKIDPLPFQAKVNGAMGQLAEAKAQRKSADARLVTARATKTDAESQHALANSRLKNAKQAFKTNAIAEEQVAVRENELRHADAALATADADIASANAAIANAEAAISSANASLTTAKLELGYTTIKAPITGRIGAHRVTRGNLISGGSALSTLLTTIVSIDPIHVYFDANEQAFLKYYRLSNTGDRKSSRDYRNPVFFSLMDESGFPHKGHMDFVDNRIDPNTGNIRGRAIFRNKDYGLTPGLFASVRVPGSARYEAVMVPDSAIASNQSTRIVMIVNADNIVEPRQVKLGPIKDGLRIIRSGLDGSEDVIVGGLQRVRPGVPVVSSPTKIESKPIANGLPNEYEPLPPEKWISRNSNDDLKIPAVNNGGHK